MRVELAEQGGEPCACSTGEGIPRAAGIPLAGAQVAAWLRRELGTRAEVCTYADGRVSFAREPGAPRTVVRGVAD